MVGRNAGPESHLLIADAYRVIWWPLPFPSHRSLKKSEVFTCQYRMFVRYLSHYAKANEKTTSDNV